MCQHKNSLHRFGAAQHQSGSFSLVGVQFWFKEVGFFRHYLVLHGGEHSLTFHLGLSKCAPAIVDAQMGCTIISIKLFTSANAQNTGNGRAWLYRQ